MWMHEPLPVSATISQPAFTLSTSTVAYGVVTANQLTQWQQILTRRLLFRRQLRSKCTDLLPHGIGEIHYHDGFAATVC